MFMVFLFVFIGFIFIGAAIPLLRRRVPPNAMYGLRVHATMANEAVWYEANARSARDLLKVGVGVIVLSVVLYFLPWSHPDYYASVCCAGLIAGTVWYCWRGTRIAREVAREIGDQ